MEEEIEDPRDYPDFEEEDGIDWECGAYGDGNDIDCWQRCTMAGTEYCDFECRFAMSVRDQIRREQEEATKQ